MNLAAETSFFTLSQLLISQKTSVSGTAPKMYYSGPMKEIKNTENTHTHTQNSTSGYQEKWKTHAQKIMPCHGG